MGVHLKVILKNNTKELYGSWKLFLPEVAEFCIYLEIYGRSEQIVFGGWGIIGSWGIPLPPLPKGVLIEHLDG